MQCSAVASKRISQVDSWRSRNGCSIRQSVAECTWGQYLQSVVKALLDLKALPECALLPDHDVVLQAQHPCLSSRGGADAKVTKPTEDHPTQTISSMPPGSGSAGAASRNQAENGVRWLARLLREHSGRVQGPGSSKEAGDE